MASKRYIIVGAGLAGCLITWRMQQAGHNVFLIGSTQLPCASEVAGGIINPVTGRWMTKSWNFDACIGHAAETYRELEKKLNISIYHSIPFTRYCLNEGDSKRLQRRMRNPRYANVIGNYTPVDKTQRSLNDTHGSFQVKQAAYVKLAQLLQKLRAHFLQQGIFRDEVFNYDCLIKENSIWSYQDIQADHILFCEGTGIDKNPWFNHLPLTPIKGETLTFKCPTLKLPLSLYHRSKWLLPSDNDLFRIGATYDENDRSETPTESGKEELLASMRSFITPIHLTKIIRHTAGLRPCTQDFRPFAGSHPVYQNLHVFNGLGSKGTLLAPELIRQFLAYLLEDAPLSKAIDCKRYLS